MVSVDSLWVMEKKMREKRKKPNGSKENKCDK
jgi:hypothetical protein